MSDENKTVNKFLIFIYLFIFPLNAALSRGYNKGDRVACYRVACLLQSSKQGTTVSFLPHPVLPGSSSCFVTHCEYEEHLLTPGWGKSILPGHQLLWRGTRDCVGDNGGWKKQWAWAQGVVAGKFVLGNSADTRFWCRWFGRELPKYLVL